MVIDVEEKIKQGHEIGSNRDAIERGCKSRAQDEVVRRSTWVKGTRQKKYRKDAAWKSSKTSVAKAE